METRSVTWRIRARCLRHRWISLLHLRGVPWARIGEFVGQRNLSVTADVYSHVLGDETELDYLELLR
jgi:integrase